MKKNYHPICLALFVIITFRFQLNYHQSFAKIIHCWMKARLH